jgi:hypothetical protein
MTYNTPILKSYDCVVPVATTTSLPAFSTDVNGGKIAALQLARLGAGNSEYLSGAPGLILAVPPVLSNSDEAHDFVEECATRIGATEFVLDHPVIVAPDGDWTNIRTWKVVRKM